MDFYTLALRLLHVGGGVIWAGTAFAIALFIQPTVNALGPDGGKFMQLMMNGTKYLKIIPLAAIATVVSGILLYVPLAQGPGFVASAQGIVLGVGGLAGIAGWVLGFGMARPLGMRMQALGAELQKAGGPPTPAQAAEMQRLREKMAATGNRITGLLLLSVACMAVARYVY